MTRMPSGFSAKVKPQPNIYTVLLVVAILALTVAIAVSAHTLLTPVAQGGYGLEMGGLFQPFESAAPPAGQ